MKLLKSILLKSYPSLNNRVQGFTLIELLVVVIILGILSAISIPNFVGQVGKARETEAKNLLGTIGRYQQGYHWERGTFASDVSSLSLGSSNYHDIPNPATVTSNLVKHQAIAITPETDRVRDFAIGVYYDAGSYSISLCQSLDVGDPVNVGDTATDDCTDNGTKLK